MSEEGSTRETRRPARFWEAHCKYHGMFADADELRDACIQYFEWAHENPLQEEKVAGGPDGPERIDVFKMRALTISGLCLFLGISRECWYKWKEDERWKETILWADAVIYTQKFEGAAAGLLNAKLIGTEIGLVDKSEQTIKGDTNAPVKVETTHTLDLSKLTDEQLAALATIRIAPDRG